METMITVKMATINDAENDGKMTKKEYRYRVFCTKKDAYKELRPHITKVIQGLKGVWTYACTDALYVQGKTKEDLTVIITVRID